MPASGGRDPPDLLHRTTRREIDRYPLPVGPLSTIDRMLTERRSLLRRAVLLAWFTVGWNVIEGVVAIAAALMAGSRALLGFGLDSGVESLSASVVLWRLYAEGRDPERAEAVEQRALRLIGITFCVLAVFIAVESVRALLGQEEPDSSIVGIVLTAVSVIVMQWLARTKRRVGIAMGSKAVEADSAQTSACVYLSIVVLVGLLLNTTLGWWWADPLAALGVVVFLIHEGREALEAKHADDCC
jgi:divalent metal cation (Fe/Co/Zn/Cd) transporter